MNPLTEYALRTITGRVNLSTGLTHPDDYSSTRELLLRLRQAGESLDVEEVVRWAEMHGWQPRFARQLGKLVAILEPDRLPTITAEWWCHDIVDRLTRQIEDCARETPHIPVGR